MDVAFFGMGRQGQGEWVCVVEGLVWVWNGWFGEVEGEGWLWKVDGLVSFLEGVGRKGT